MYMSLTQAQYNTKVSLVNTKIQIYTHNNHCGVMIRMCTYSNKCGSENSPHYSVLLRT